MGRFFWWVFFHFFLFNSISLCRGEDNQSINHLDGELDEEEEKCLNSLNKSTSLKCVAEHISNSHELHSIAIKNAFLCDFLSYAGWLIARDRHKLKFYKNGKKILNFLNFEKRKKILEKFTTLANPQKKKPSLTPRLSIASLLPCVCVCHDDSTSFNSFPFCIPLPLSLRLISVLASRCLKITSLAVKGGGERKRKHAQKKSKKGSCLLLFSEYNKSHLNGNKSRERERSEGRRMARNRQKRTLKMHSFAL